MAGDVASPARWKKRTLSATRAAELGTARAMKRIANWRPITGPRRRGRGQAPIVENASATCTSGETRSATQIHPASAFDSSEVRVSIPTLEKADTIAKAPK